MISGIKKLPASKRRAIVFFGRHPLERTHLIARALHGDLEKQGVLFVRVPLGETPYGRAGRFKSVLGDIAKRLESGELKGDSLEWEVPPRELPRNSPGITYREGLAAFLKKAVAGKLDFESEYPAFESNDMRDFKRYKRDLETIVDRDYFSGDHRLCELLESSGISVPVIHLHSQNPELHSQYPRIHTRGLYEGIRGQLYGLAENPRHPFSSATAESDAGSTFFRFKSGNEDFNCLVECRGPKRMGQKEAFVELPLDGKLVPKQNQTLLKRLDSQLYEIFEGVGAEEWHQFQTVKTNKAQKAMFLKNARALKRIIPIIAQRAKVAA